VRYAAAATTNTNDGDDEGDEVDDPRFVSRPCPVRPDLSVQLTPKYERLKQTTACAKSIWARSNFCAFLKPKEGR
jgi:hypothetical protein